MLSLKHCRQMANSENCTVPTSRWQLYIRFAKLNDFGFYCLLNNLPDLLKHSRAILLDNFRYSEKIYIYLSHLWYSVTLAYTGKRPKQGKEGSEKKEIVTPILQIWKTRLLRKSAYRIFAFTYDRTSNFQFWLISLLYLSKHKCHTYKKKTNI